MTSAIQDDGSVTSEVYEIEFIMTSQSQSHGYVYDVIMRIYDVIITVDDVMSIYNVIMTVHNVTMNICLECMTS